MSTDVKDRSPIVFLSYSHDSKEHKEWVAKLAVTLVEKGIDVLFDQFDLGPGDDVPKFMEHAVTNSDRVLMVCTEAYVRKADDGKGGVGYEAMIVTGELVRNLGTNKFIPIVRQSGSERTLPKCVSTRLYVDMSEGVDEFESLDSLLREIHQIRKLMKPVLGRSPFVSRPFEGSAPRAARDTQRLEFSQALANPEEAYHRALAIARSGDRIAWRKLMQASADHGARALSQWRKEIPHIGPFSQQEPDNLLKHAKVGLDAYMPFIACLVAGAESGVSEFGGQLGWIDAMLKPRDWDPNGSIYWADFPATVVFVTQALVGGMLLISESGDSEYRLATTNLSERQGRDAGPLFAQTRINGWPDSLEHSCTVAWRFLNVIIQENPWLTTAFGSREECRAAVTGHYLFLTFLNFISKAKAGKLDGETQEPFIVHAPLCCLVWSPDILAKGYDLLLQQSDLLLKLLQNNGIDDIKFGACWQVWIQISARWIAEVYREHWPRITLPHTNLPRDLNLPLHKKTYVLQDL